MTEAQIKERWVRYLHRSDMVGDLDLTWEIATLELGMIWMGKGQLDIADLINRQPKAMVDAGVAELNRIAGNEEIAAVYHASAIAALGAYTLARSRQLNPTVRMTAT